MYHSVRASVAGALLVFPLAAQQLDVISREVSVQVVPDGPLDVVSREVSVQVVPSGPLDVVSREFSVAVPGLDVAAALVQLPSNVTAGAYVDVQWSVANVGGITAVAPWTDALLLSTDTVAGNGDDVVLWSAPRTANVVPGTSYGATTEVWIPPTAQGVMHVLLQVDRTAVLDEGGSLANNVAAQAIVVGGFAGRVLTDQDLVSEIDPLPLGNVVVDGGTVTMDGAHSMGSLTLRNGAVLTHTPGSASGMQLQVSGDVRIDPGCRIDVSGKGHPAGEGPGASGGVASHAGAAGSSHKVYGSLRRPRALGSGGAGPGGGFVSLSVGGNLRVLGDIVADGLAGGAGGSIAIEATEVSGVGTIAVRGQGGGSGGRVAIVYGNGVSGGNSFVGEVLSHGTGGAAAGTQYERDNVTGSGHELVVIDNAGQTWWSPNNPRQVAASTYLPHGMQIFGDVVVTGGGSISYPPGGEGVELEISGHLLLDAGSCVHAQQRGLRGELGFALDCPAGSSRSSAGGHGQYGNCGAGHGGAGGPGAYPLPTLPTGCAAQGSGLMPFGGAYDPQGNLPGSGGTRGLYSIETAPVGGGVIHINAATMQLDGGVMATGQHGGAYSGGASGGSIRLTAASGGGGGRIDASGGRSEYQICGQVAGNGGGGVVFHPVGFSGIATAAGGDFAATCWGLQQIGGNGPVNVGVGTGVPIPTPLSGGDDFDALSVGSAPDNVDASAGTRGRAGAWSVPFGYPVNPDEQASIVATSTFDPASAGNSLQLLSSGDATFVAANFAEEFAARPGGIVRFEGRVWAGPGLIALGRGTNAIHGAAPQADLGPTIEWLADGRIVAWTGGLLQSQDLVAAAPSAQWQAMRMDIDLTARTFDFWWASAGQPLTMVAMDVPFVTPHALLDRVIVGNRQGVAAELRVDDLVFDDEWCLPRGVEYGVGTAGTLGVPSIGIVKANTTQLQLGNSSGIATFGIVVVSLTPLEQQLFGGTLLVQPDALVGVSIPAGGLTVPLLPRVMPSGSTTWFLQSVQFDPGAPEALAFSRGLAVVCY